MDSSGIAAFQAMEILRDGSSEAAAAAINAALKLMKTGVSPARAWSHAGLLRNWQAELLDAGFAGGRGEWVLRSLAEHLTDRADRWNRFKSRMVFPLAILLLASLLSALPPLVAGQIGFFGFLIRVVGAPVLIVGLVVAGIRALQSARDGPPSSFIVQLPAIGKWLRLRARADFLAITAQALRAGIPALQALPLASNAIRPVTLGRGYANATDLVAGGMPVAEALRQTGALDDTGFALVTAGEASGTLDGLLERSAAAADRSAEAYADQVAIWIPRLLYLLVAALMVSRILGFWTSYSPGG